MSMKKTETNAMAGVIYCFNCCTDLRLENYSLHKNDLGHEVKIYKHDPRDKRFPIEEFSHEKNKTPKFIKKILKEKSQMDQAFKNTIG